MRRTDRYPRLFTQALGSTLALVVLTGGALRAQTCGDGMVDPPEECDPPASISCPPGSPAGAFLACNGDCTCPTATLTTTTATATTTTTIPFVPCTGPVATCVDHFTC